MLHPKRLTKWSELVILGLVVAAVSAGSIVSYDSIFEKPSQLFDESNQNPQEFMQKLVSLTPDEIVKKISEQKSRLKASSLDGNALSNLSILYLLNGKNSESDQLAVTASEISLRDPYAQYFVTRAAMAKHDYAEAFYHLDAALTAHAELSDTIFPLALSFDQDEKGYAELVKALNRNPPWRGKFFDWLVDRDNGNESTYKIFSQINSNGTKVAEEELRKYLAKLVSKKYFERAYFVWLNSLPKAEVSKVNWLFDGGFESERRNNFFDWTSSAFPNGSLSYASRSDTPENKALRLSFYSSTAAFENVSQLLRLPEGRFSFSGTTSSQGFVSPGGLDWTIICLPNEQVLGKSLAFKNTYSWQKFGFDFVVPTENCATQKLLLKSAGLAILDYAMTGVIEFDDFLITNSARVDSGG